MDTLEKLSDCYSLKIAIPRNITVSLLDIIEVACLTISPLKILSVFPVEEENICQICVKDIETFCFLLREGICIQGVQLSPLPSVACYTVYCPYPMVTNDNLIDLFSNYGTVLKVNHVIAFPNRRQLDHIISEKRRVVFYLAGQVPDIHLPEVINEKVGNWKLSLKVFKFCIACLHDGHDILNCQDLKSFALEQDCSNEFNMKPAMGEGQQNGFATNTVVEQTYGTRTEREDSPECDDIMESVLNTMNELDDSSSGNDLIETIGDYILNEEFTIAPRIDRKITSALQENKETCTPQEVNKDIAFPDEVNKEIAFPDEVNKEITSEHNNDNRIYETDNQQKIVTSSTNKASKSFRNFRERSKKHLLERSYKQNLRLRHKKTNSEEHELSFESDDELEDFKLKRRKIYRKRKKDKSAMSEFQVNDSHDSPEDKHQSSSSDISNESADEVSKDYKNKNRKSRKRLPSLSDTDSFVNFKRSQSSFPPDEKASVYFKDLEIPDVKLGILDNASLREFLIASEDAEDILQLSSTFTAFKDKIREQISNLCDVLDFRENVNYEYYKKLSKLHKELW